MVWVFVDKSDGGVDVVGWKFPKLFGGADKSWKLKILVRQSSLVWMCGSGSDGVSKKNEPEDAKMQPPPKKCNRVKTQF